MCDIDIIADNIATPVVPVPHTRHPKRSFADVDQEPGAEPNSDELYGWIEDDEVAAEGLLIEDEAPVDNPEIAKTRLDVVTDGHNKKVARTAE